MITKQEKEHSDNGEEEIRIMAIGFISQSLPRPPYSLCAQCALRGNFLIPAAFFSAARLRRGDAGEVL